MVLVGITGTARGLNRLANAALDQYELFRGIDAEPDFVIAAVEVDVAEVMLRIAREVHDLTFSGKVYAFDLGSGVLDVKLNPSFAPPDSDTDFRETLERARSEITAGWVEIEELGIGR